MRYIQMQFEPCLHRLHTLGRHMSLSLFSVQLKLHHRNYAEECCSIIFLKLSLLKSVELFKTASVLLPDCSPFITLFCVKKMPSSTEEYMYSNSPLNGVGKKTITCQIEIRLHSILSLYLWNFTQNSISTQTFNISLEFD